MGNPLDPVIRDRPPCKGCKEKFTACHDHCKNFKVWKAELERIKKNRKEYMDKPFSKIL